MGWVRKRKEMDWYLVEPNLTSLSPYVGNVRNPQTEDLVPFSKLDDDELNLSCFCNWRSLGVVVVPCTCTRERVKVRSRKIK